MVSKSTFNTNFGDEEIESGHKFTADVELESNVNDQEYVVSMSITPQLKINKDLVGYLTW